MSELLNTPAEPKLEGMLEHTIVSATANAATLFHDLFFSIIIPPHNIL
jgi:hypothetical protein